MNQLTKVGFKFHENDAFIDYTNEKENVPTIYSLPLELFIRVTN